MSKERFPKKANHVTMFWGVPPTILLGNIFVIFVIFGRFLVNFLLFSLYFPSISFIRAHMSSKLELFESTVQIPVKPIYLEVAKSK